MKRIILTILTVICLTGCDKMFLAAVDLSTPDPRLSFKANGELFKTTGANTNTLRIYEIPGEGFAITLSGGGNWDTENTMKSAEIHLNCGIFKGSPKKGTLYAYTAEEMDTYPYFKHTISEKVESSYGGSTYQLKTMWYNASDGWIKISKMNKNKGLISGSFEFNAVCDDPSNGEVIEITKGTFKDITYIVVSGFDGK